MGKLLVFLIVTVQAKVFPVAAVPWIVIVIVIFVVHGQLMQILARELTPTAGANPRIEAQRLFPVALETLLPFLTRFGNDRIELIRVALAGSRLVGIMASRQH